MYVDIIILTSLVLSFNLKTIVLGQKDGEEIIDFANLELDQKYLKGVRWAIEQAQKKDGKIEVYHAIEVVDISKVDVETMSVRIEIHLRQRWESKDLNLPEGLFEAGDSEDTFIRAPPAILNSLWSPDSFIPYARDSKIASFTTSQAVVNIFQNKSIVYKARLYTVLGCAFSFQWYPLDKQTCDLTIESYTVPSDMVSYLWETHQTPVVLTNLKLLQYDMVLPLMFDNGTASRWGTGVTYPYVLLRFAFERQLAHHMIQVFTPTILVVILSWFSFWLGLDAVPGRISLLITCVLALITMMGGLKGSIPPVNYIKMMDIWMVCCIAFVFAACFEFVIVKYLHWRNQQNLKAKEEKDKAMEKYMAEHKNPQNNNPGPDSKRAFNPYLEFYKNLKDNDIMGSEGPFPADMLQQRRANISNFSKPAWEDFQLNRGMMPPSDDLFHPMIRGYPGAEWPFAPKKKPIWVSIDRVSRVAFPAMFLAFNLAFWPYLLVGAANQA